MSTLVPKLTCLFVVALALCVCLGAEALALPPISPALKEAERLQKMADSLYEGGKYAEAVEPAERALKIVEKLLGPEHPNVAKSLNNLARLYYEQGRYAEAEPLYQRALKIGEKTLGPEHPNVGTALDNLAQLYSNQ